MIYYYGSRFTMPMVIDIIKKYFLNKWDNLIFFSWLSWIIVII